MLHIIFITLYNTYYTNYKIRLYNNNIMKLYFIVVESNYNLIIPL